MKLKFLGAAEEVTGSCFLLQCGEHRVLIECGLIQGGEEDEARNREPFAFNPETIDAVILTHAHLDHSGRIPLLIQAGFRGPIYTHAASYDLCRIMLKDAAYLNEKDAEWDNRKRRRRDQPLVEPLYTMADALAALQRFKPLPYDETREILPGISIRLNDAGHILGSAIVELWAQEGDVRRKLVFSGDLGHHGAPILKDPARIDEADLVVMESTYGDRLHRSWEATWAELADIIRDSRRGRGNIIIPAFAVGRSQELLYVFGKNAEAWGVDRWEIFLDSPMAIEATEVYAKHPDLYDREAATERRERGNPFHLPNLHLSRRAEDSMAINRITDGAIIIAGSGMCTGGRIRHHLKHNLWRRDCQVIIVGFQARGTLGRALVDGADEVQLWGEPIKVSATIHTVGGLSAHADRAGLLGWYKNFKGRPPVLLVHGESEALQGLKTALEAAGATAAEIARPGQVVAL
ncbi:MAG: MBL fold metallo-hydrolase [Pseudomonadota bacterium]